MPHPRSEIYRGQFAAATLGLGLFAGPVRAAPADLSQPTSTSCWDTVEQHKAAARERWTARDPSGALESRLAALEAAVSCEDGTPDQRNSVQIIFENVFFQIEEGAMLTRERADELHRWYHAAESRYGSMSPGATDAYRKFSQRMPPPSEPPEPPAPEPPAPEPPAPEPPAPGSGTDPDPPLVVVKPKATPHRGLKPHRGLMIGGGVLLAAGIGGLGAGLGVLRLTLDTQGDLNSLCTPTCPDSDQRSDLIRRGELGEVLAPALIATGAAASVAGGVLVGLGVRRRNTSRFAPVLHPRYVGASWAIQF